MNGTKKVRVLQVDEGLDHSDILAQSIFDTGNEVIVRISVTEDICAFVRKYSPDLLMIDMQYPGKAVLGQLVTINETNPVPIVFFAEKTESEITSAVVKAGVSAFVVDGLQVSRIKPVMDIAIARFEQTRAMQQELNKTRETLAERKLIDKAKGILMKQKSLDEEHAYRVLRSMAMNQNKKIGMVAREVIDIAGILF